jgi:general stress protein 26
MQPSNHLRIEVVTIDDCNGVPHLRKMIAAKDRIFISTSSNKASDDMEDMMRRRIVHIDFSKRETQNERIASA